jgi:hypothetical protein
MKNMAILIIISTIALFLCTTAFNVNIIPSRTRNMNNHNIDTNKKSSYNDNNPKRSKDNRYFGAFMSSNEFDDDEDKKKNNRLFTRDTVHT